MRSTGWRSGRAGVALGLALALGISAAPEPAAAESAAYDAFTGIGAGLCTLVYSPLKVTYAVTGSVVSGLAWLWTFGDTSLAGPIFTSAVRGDYVVTPAHLEGRRGLSFRGSSY